MVDVGDAREGVDTLVNCRRFGFPWRAGLGVRLSFGGRSVGGRGAGPGFMNWSGRYILLDVAISILCLIPILLYGCVVSTHEFCCAPAILAASRACTPDCSERLAPPFSFHRDLVICGHRR